MCGLEEKEQVTQSLILKVERSAEFVLSLMQDLRSAMNAQDQVLWLMKFRKRNFSGGILRDNKYCFDST